MIRVLLVDDYEGWWRHIYDLLQDRPELQVVCEASDGIEAVQKAGELKPDLIVLDIGLPNLDGINASRQIRQLSPGSKILFLSQDNSVDVIQAAMSTGAQGYVYKAAVQSDLLPAIDVVLQGMQFVSSSMEGHKYSGFLSAKAPHRHEILFYSNDTVLLDSFTRFMAAALKVDNTAIALVTKSHEESLRHRLNAEGVDVDGYTQRGTLIFLNVDDTLAIFMADGLLDRSRFFEGFNSLIGTAIKGTQAEHPRVAFCGELIGRLWAEGKTAVAAQLEQICNELSKTHELDLLCAYPSSGFRGSDDEDVLKSIYAEHSGVHSWRSLFRLRN
jgi:DNA-binding NarL/FixJ family response regulator